jgi:hypothetical protein
MTFKFELTQFVDIDTSGERGQIIGRAEYSHCENSYFVRYKTMTGTAQEMWWSESALVIAGT